MKTVCPHCTQEFEVPDNYESQEVTCTVCNQNFVVRKAKFCPECGTINSFQTFNCKKCGKVFLSDTWVTSLNSDDDNTASNHSQQMSDSKIGSTSIYCGSGAVVGSLCLIALSSVPEASVYLNYLLMFVIIIVIVAVVIGVLAICKGMRKSGMAGIVLGCVGGFMCFFHLSALASSLERTRIMSCNHQLKQLAISLLQYEIDYSQFPSDTNGNIMQVLRAGNYLPNGELSCPLNKFGMSYIYLGDGLNCTRDDISDLPIVMDNPLNHQSWNIVMGGGWVMILSSDKLKTCEDIVKYIMQENAVSPDLPVAKTILENAKKADYAIFANNSDRKKQAALIAKPETKQETEHRERELAIKDLLKFKENFSEYQYGTNAEFQERGNCVIDFFARYNPIAEKLGLTVYPRDMVESMAIEASCDSLDGYRIAEKYGVLKSIDEYLQEHGK